MITTTTTYTSSMDAPEMGAQIAVASSTRRISEGDAKLVKRLRMKDELAFDELIERHHGALIRLAMAYVPDRSVAEEVVQDTWLAVIENLDRFEGRSSLRTWIFGILIHKAKDRGVREKRHTTFSDLGRQEEDGDEAAVDPSRFHASGDLAGQWALPPQPWDDATPEKLLASQQAVACMQRAIDALPANLKQVLILRDVEGINCKDVCALLKITETNLYVRLHRARERVRQAVEQYLEGKAADA